MRVVVQRTGKTKLSVGGKEISAIDSGLVAYIGVKKGDEKIDADYIVKKIVNLRIFEDENGKMNLSIKDVGGQILAVSQFTLYGDTSGGNRPSFFEAELPDKANELYEYVLSELNKHVVTKPGVFGADMTIEQTNLGPVTIIMESKSK